MEAEYQIRTSTAEADPEKNEFKSTVEETSPPAFTFPSFPDGGAQAWLVVVGAMLANGCSFGYITAFGVYETYYLDHQLSHKNASQISWIGSIQLFFVFGGGLFGGAIFDRYGARRVMIPAMIFYVFSVMLTSICKEYYQFILAQAILGGLSNGFLFTPAMSCVNHYFHEKRGAAMGAVAVGSSLGGVLVPIILEKCFYSKVGFGWGVRIIGFGMLGLLSISCALVKERLPPRKGALFMPEAFLQPSYVCIVSGTFMLFLAVFLPYFYITEYALTKIHMGTDLAFYLLSIMNASSLLGRTVFGSLSDKLGLMNLLTVIAVCNSIVIFCWTLTDSNAGLIVWTLFYGFFSGAIFSLFPASYAQVTPKPQLIGTYMGQAMAANSLAVLSGSPIAGALVDRYGYRAASIFSGVMFLVAAVFIGAARFFHQPSLKIKA